MAFWYLQPLVQKELLVFQGVHLAFFFFFKEYKTGVQPVPCQLSVRSKLYQLLLTVLLLNLTIFAFISNKKLMV